MIAVSECARMALLYDERAALRARRREIERLLASDDTIECLVGAAALTRLLSDEAWIDRAIGAAFLADRLQSFAFVARFAERPGELIWHQLPSDGRAE